MSVDIEEICGALPERTRRGRSRGLTFSEWFDNQSEAIQSALVERAREYGNPVPMTVSKTVMDADGNPVQKVPKTGGDPYNVTEVVGGLLPDIQAFADHVGGNSPTVSSVREQAPEVLEEYGIEFISRNTDDDDDSESD